MIAPSGASMPLKKAAERLGLSPHDAGKLLTAIDFPASIRGQRVSTEQVQALENDIKIQGSVRPWMTEAIGSSDPVVTTKPNRKATR